MESVDAHVLRWADGHAPRGASFPAIRGGHSKRFCLRFWRDSELILRRIGGVEFGPSLTTPLCSEGILDAILHVDGSGWLVQAEAEAEAAILEPNAPPESLLQKRRF